MPDQPMPTPNDNPSIQSLVRTDLERREQLGVERYGTPLQAHNGRDALVDAYEESLDLACYLRQAIEERTGAAAPVPSRRAQELAADEALGMATTAGHRVVLAEVRWVQPLIGQDTTT